jgi:hypothetical protein
MSVLGVYRSSGVTRNSGSSVSGRIINLSGFKPSGMDNGNILGVALYVWSGSLKVGSWMPLRREWL